MTPQLVTRAQLISRPVLVLLILRVYAVWSCSKKILALLGIMYTVR